MLLSDIIYYIFQASELVLTFQASSNEQWLKVSYTTTIDIYSLLS